MAAQQTLERFSKYKSPDEIKNLTYQDFLRQNRITPLTVSAQSFENAKKQALIEWSTGVKSRQYTQGNTTPSDRLKTPETPYAPFNQSGEAQQFYFSNPSADWFKRYQEAHPGEKFDEGTIKRQLENRLKEFGKSPKGLLFEADLLNQAAEYNLPSEIDKQSKLYSNMIKNQTADAMSGVQREYRKRNVLAGSALSKQTGREANLEAATKIDQGLNEIELKLKNDLIQRKKIVTQAGLEIASMNAQASQKYLNDMIDEMKMRNASISSLFQGVGTGVGYYLGMKNSTNTTGGNNNA